MAPTGNTNRHDEKLLRYAVVLGILLALICVYYLEEDWRGRHSWKQLKRQLEAQGALIDWTNFVPAPVSADQNFYDAPKMQKWFVGRGGCDLSANLSGARDSFIAQHPRDVIATVTIARPGEKIAEGAADIVIDYKSHPAKDGLGKMMSNAIAAVTNELHGRIATTSLGLRLLAEKPAALKPVRVVVRSDFPLTTNAVAALFPELHDSFNAGPPSRPCAMATGDASFEVRLNQPAYVSAADYLAWSDAQAGDFDLIRDALKRPCAQMQGDYRYPPSIPVPNFVCLRVVAQTMADRAKCHLLNGQPGEAVKDLALVRGLCRAIESPHPTLVATMINAAITALYSDVIAEGMRLHAWREPDLAVLQGQLQEINLLPLLAGSFQMERACACDVLQDIKPANYSKLFGSPPSANLWDRLKDPNYLMLELAPRGWIYQNMSRVALVESRFLQGFDPANHHVSTAQMEKALAQVSADLSQFRPYNYLAAMFVPNFTRAIQTLSRNQCMADEALIVCGLERYRAANGQYPKVLEALVPRFMEKIPKDIISGEALHYRLKEDGQFVLYSVGWNAKDDGGVTSRNKDGSADMRAGDWVWGDRPW